MMALQSTDSLKIRKDPVQKNKGATFQSQKKSHQFQRATFHMNNLHYNKYKRTQPSEALFCVS